MIKQKIIITGGLGYIGSKVCELFSGESRYKDITVVDNRFSSGRVKQLKSWGIKYVNTSIMNEETITNIISAADVVIHLAGITNVAYTNTEADSEQDKLITDAEDFFNNWQNYGNDVDKNNVNTLNAS